MHYRLFILFAVVLISCQTTEETRVTDELPAENPNSPGDTETDVEKPSESPTPDESTTQNEVAKATHGAEVYGRVCVTCHGKSGDGRGMEMKLFGFDAPAEDWKHGPTVEGIKKTLVDGIHDSSMKSFDYYSEGDREAVALYVLELRERLLEAQSQEASEPSTEK